MEMRMMRMVPGGEMLNFSYKDDVESDDNDSLVVDAENNNEDATEKKGALDFSGEVPECRPLPIRRRMRRRTASSTDPAEALTEMSVRGLNLFRYASINEGVYKCMECAKADVLKTFKNKYSFQRHAFLYHEGHQRKVFPCPVCAKEFSRPDKMKNHMKMVHDCFIPKEYEYHGVSVSLSEDVSITPFRGRSDSVSQDELVISPTPAEDVTLNPVQFAPHFLSHEALLQIKEESAEETEDDSPGATPPRRRDLLEYLMNEDGTVVCKRCGELLPSRTQWYRHKYKFHIESPPAALFKCYRCNVFFKSRKGYLGHLSTRHSRMEERVVIPCKRGRRTSEDIQSNPEDYEKQREKEEKLVADIIDRVKRECEAQGSTVTRKGYSRRSTIMNT